MSTKEILSRLTRTPSDAARTRNAPASAPPTSGSSDQETRVSGGIIRRRRATESTGPSVPEPQAPQAPQAATGRTATIPRTSPARGATAPAPIEADSRTEQVIEPAIERVEPASVPVPSPETLEEPLAAQAVGPDSAGVEVQAELPASETAAPAEAPDILVEPVPEPSPALPAAAPAEPSADGTLTAEAPRAVEPVVVEPAPVTIEPVRVAEAQAVRSPEATPAPGMRGRVAAQETRVSERPRPGSTQETGRALPTLGQRAHEGSDKADAPRTVGLGKAVVRPPPGYDPNDPLGNRRRAREAAEASVRPVRGPAAPQAPGAPTAPVEGAPWTGGPHEPPPANREDQRELRAKGRPRKKDRNVGRVEMLVEDVPVEMRRKRRVRGGAKKASPPPKAQKRRVQVDGKISVAALAQAMSVKGGELVSRLLKLGKPATLNEMLDFDTAALVAAEFLYEVVDVGFKEEDHFLQVEEEEEGRVSRPPVVTIMGHVDHGKTSLLDKIRKTEVAAHEAGGITQHVGAYQVKHGDALVTFIDTPGHAAFTAMRARGAQVTDIVVLVVAADDGVMPQTIESINHTRAADVPIVVAINKCDKAGVKPDLIRRRLMDQDLVAEEYGGDTQMVNVSAHTGKGIPELLEAILLQAEMQELKANPERHAEGTVLESRLERGRGPVATVIIQEGTLKQGDHFVAGLACGRVRAMSDFTGKPIKSAGPSTPVEIMGFEEIPVAGDNFVVVESEKAARALAEHRLEESKAQNLKERQRFTLEDIYAQQRKEDEKKICKLIVKCDVQGSVEAIQVAMGELKVEGAEVSVLHSGVGAISESDVSLAAAYQAIIIGFNVRPDGPARKAAEQTGVDIRGYTIIYELLDDVRKAMVGLLAPITEEKHEGTAEVRDTFMIPKVGLIAGCFVIEGRVARNHEVRLVRDGVVVWEGRASSLRRFKDDVREVQKGLECGIGLDGYNDVKAGDHIEFHSRVRIAATG